MASRYDLVAIVLHWSIALLILAAFFLGLTVDNFPKAWEQDVVNTHVLIGLAVLVLTIVRVAWRVGHKPPPLPAAARGMEKVSKLVHLFLYCLMVLVPIIGIPTLLYRGRGIDFGLITLPPVLARTPEVFRPLTELHELSAYALLALALAHVLAAFYHQAILRDRLISRMLPSALGPTV